MKYIISIVFLLITLISQGQTDKYFRKTYGQTYPNYENGQTVKVTASGYILAGQDLITVPTPDGNGHFIKTDKYGIPIWENSIIDTLTNCGIFASEIAYDKYYFSGELTSYISGKTRSYLVKFDTLGINYQQYLLGDTVYDNGVKCMTKTTDGNFLLGGWIQDPSSFWQGNLIKIDSSGVELWHRKYSGNLNSWINGITELSNGNLLLSGITNTVLGSGKTWCLYTNSNGNIISDTSYFVGLQSPINDVQFSFSMDTTLDNGRVFAGACGIWGVDIRGLIFKTLPNGLIDWYRMLSSNPDGSGNIWTSELDKVIQLPDSTFICIGTIKTNSASNYKMLLIKFDFWGNELWRRYFVGFPTYDSYGYSLQTTNDEGYILSGRAENITDADAFLVKTNCLGYTHPPVANFSFITSNNIATFYNLSQYFSSCVYHFGDGDSSILSFSDTLPVTHMYSSPGNYQPYLIAYACGESDTLLQQVYVGLSNHLENDEITFQVFPTLTSEKIYIDLDIKSFHLPGTLKIYNLFGQMLSEIPITSKLDHYPINLSFLNSGCYFVSLETNSYRVNRKINIIK